MVLEFRPPNIDPNAETRSQRSLRILNETLSDIGNQAVQRRQQEIQNMLAKSQNAREGAKTRADLGYDPGSGETPPDINALLSPSQGASDSVSGWSTPGSPSAPPATSVSSAPPQGPEPEGSVDWSKGMQGPEPGGYVDHTQHFLNWQKMGMPSTYDHPDYGGTGSNIPQNPMDLYRTMAKIPGSTNQQLFLKAQDEARKQREEADKYSMGGANSLYSTPEQAAFQLAPNDPAKQKSLVDQFNTLYPGGKVPKSAVTATGGGIHFDVTQGTKTDQFTQKRLTALGDALDPSKQRQGAFGVSKGVFDRAERLESLANAFPGGNLDSRQIEELAIGLNSMLQGGNVGAAEQVRNLVPNTIWGNGQKIAEWLSNDPRGTQQQAFVNRMLGTVSREKQTAADQIKRTQFSRIGRYADLENTNPDEFNNTLQSAGVDPDEYRQWKKGGYKPMSAVQSPEGGNGKASIFNGKKPRADGKIMVSNGQQSFWINPQDAASAAKDGYQ